MNVQFLYPHVLYGLTAIIIPIIIHLFNFRRYKTVYFSNIQFLKDIKQKTQAKSRLKHLLVLFSRILAVCAVVLAFAQPYIPIADDSKKDTQDIVSIYLDNSFSMESEGKYGNLLEVAKNQARKIIDSYRPNTKFLLITNDLEVRHQHLINKEQLFEYLSEVSVTSKVVKMSTVLSRQQDFIGSFAGDAGENHNSIFLISDFQKSTSDFSKITNDSMISIYLLPVLSNTVNNLFIDSCWFETPGRKVDNPEELHVSIRNNSTESFQNIPIELFLDDSLKALGSFSIDPDAEAEVVLNYTNSKTGIMQGKIQINDYPVVFDNTYFFSYSIADSISVLVINEQEDNKYLDALFKDDYYFRLVNFSVKSIDYSQFPKFHVIIVNSLKTLSSGMIQQLTEFANNGGNVILFPDMKSEISTYNNLLTALNGNYFTGVDSNATPMKKIDFENVLYKNVFAKINENLELPTLNKHLQMSSISHSSDISLLSTVNNHSILSELPCGTGKFYIFAFSLSKECSNFPQHPIYVPTLYNIALNSKPSGDIFQVIGREESIQLHLNSPTDPNMPIRILSKSSDFEMIPRNRLTGSLLLMYFEDQQLNAGNYFVMQEATKLGGLAFNYDRTESNLTCFSLKELENEIGQNDLFNFMILETSDTMMTNALQQLQKGKPLWKWFILMVLIFLAAETLMLRLWR